MREPLIAIVVLVVAYLTLASFSDEELGRIDRLDAESTSSTGC